jgi:hypothetical protein
MANCTGRFKMVQVTWKWRTVMSDAEKNDGGLARREFAKTVAAGVAAVAAAHPLSALETHAAQGASETPTASGNQEERDLCHELSAFAVRTKWEDLPLT